MLHPRFWQHDGLSRACMHCERPFSLLRRRHHCRHCGLLYCGECTPHRLWLRPLQPLQPPSVHDAAHSRCAPASNAVCADNVVVVVAARTTLTATTTSAARTSPSPPPLLPGDSFLASLHTSREQQQQQQAQSTAHDANVTTASAALATSRDALAATWRSSGVRDASLSTVTSCGQNSMYDDHDSHNAATTSTRQQPLQQGTCAAAAVSSSSLSPSLHNTDRDGSTLVTSCRSSSSNTSGGNRRYTTTNTASTTTTTTSATRSDRRVRVSPWRSGAARQDGTGAWWFFCRVCACCYRRLIALMQQQQQQQQRERHESVASVQPPSTSQSVATERTSTTAVAAAASSYNNSNDSNSYVSMWATMWSRLWPQGSMTSRDDSASQRGRRSSNRTTVAQQPQQRRHVLRVHDASAAATTALTSVARRARRVCIVLIDERATRASLSSRHATATPRQEQQLQDGVAEGEQPQRRHGRDVEHVGSSSSDNDATAALSAMLRDVHAALSSTNARRRDDDDADACVHSDRRVAAAAAHEVAVTLPLHVQLLRQRNDSEGSGDGDTPVAHVLARVTLTGMSKRLAHAPAAAVATSSVHNAHPQHVAMLRTMPLLMSTNAPASNTTAAAAATCRQHKVAMLQPLLRQLTLRSVCTDAYVLVVLRRNENDDNNDNNNVDDAADVRVRHADSARVRPALNGQHLRTLYHHLCACGGHAPCVGVVDVCARNVASSATTTTTAMTTTAMTSAACATLSLQQMARQLALPYRRDGYDDNTDSDTCAMRALLPVLEDVVMTCIRRDYHALLHTSPLP